MLGMSTHKLSQNGFWRTNTSYCGAVILALEFEATSRNSERQLLVTKFDNGTSAARS